MQIFIQEHQVIIKTELITEEKLRITAELLESQQDEALRRAVQGVIEQLKPKIKKRIKFKDIQSKFANKVNLAEFKSEV